MAIKKNNHDDMFDVMALIRQWWYHRKFVILGTIIITLIITFFLVLFNKALTNHNQKYIMAILHGDLAENNSRIVAAFKSQEYLQEAIDRTGMKINPSEILDNIIIKNSSDPLKEGLSDRIASLEHKDLKKLSLSNDDLTEMVKSINDNSKNSMTIQMFHLPMGMSEIQAKNLIIILSNIVNKEILLRTSREDLKLSSIDLKSVEILNNNFEQFTRLTGMVDTIQSNIGVMREKYGELLVNVDFRSLDNLANLSQKLLHEVSIKMGNTIAIDTLNVNIENKDNDISDLQQSLRDLNAYNQASQDTTSDKENKGDFLSSRGVSAQLDGGIFDKILQMGGALSFNDFRLNTMQKIQVLQNDRNSLIKQRDLLNLPMSANSSELTIKSVSDRIVFLSHQINSAIAQIRNFTEPKAALRIINNPELVELESKTMSELLLKLITFSTLSFLILSIISLLLPSKIRIK